ncbi:nitroreductase family protein [Verrucomicrobium spinosum]|uniref:nitroreductase family protein n=2 Tax=Verrucomicrobium spinosum TaxID=2736 RepID=UPI000174467E|nr:nitroreductase [Verrucomicrobium spinosum]
MSEAALNPFQSITDHIRHRRSVKPADMDPGRPVGRGLLEALMENANQAPTHGMTEPWRFHVIQGAARADLATCMQAVYREIMPALEFREDKYRKITESTQLAPVIIAIVMARRGGAKIPELEEIEAVACAVQNLHLSASAAGLAGYWSTPALVYERQFADWLQLGPDDRCLGLFYLGWPKPGFVWPEGRRSPVQGKITWHGEATVE